MPSPIENISWNSLPMAGVYTIEVSQYGHCGNPNPQVPFTVIIKQKNAPEKRIEGTVDAANPRYDYQFTVEGH